MLKGKQVEVQVDIDKTAKLINSMESLAVTFLETLPPSPDNEKDLEAVLYLREKNV